MTATLKYTIAFTDRITSFIPFMGCILQIAYAVEFFGYLSSFRYLFLHEIRVMLMGFLIYEEPLCVDYGWIHDISYFN